MSRVACHAISFLIAVRVNRKRSCPPSPATVDPLGDPIPILIFVFASNIFLTMQSHAYDAALVPCRRNLTAVFGRQFFGIAIQIVAKFFGGLKRASIAAVHRVRKETTDFLVSSLHSNHPAGGFSTAVGVFDTRDVSTWIFTSHLFVKETNYFRTTPYCSILRYRVARLIPSSSAALGTLLEVRFNASTISLRSQ